MLNDPHIEQRYKPERSALFVSGLLLLASLIWIIGSDHLLGEITQDPEMLLLLSSIKGVAFVFSISALTYFLVRVRIARIVDATTRYRALALDLERARQLQRFGFDAALLGTWHIDFEEQKIHCDERAAKHLGIDAASALDALFLKLQPEDQVRARTAFNSLLARTHRLEPAEYRIRNSNGQFRWIVVNASLQLIEGKQTLIGTSQDVTERKVIEERQTQLLQTLEASGAELRRQKLLFESVFEYAPDPIILTDLDKNIINVNPAFGRVFGHQLDQIQGRGLQPLFENSSEWEQVGASLEREDAFKVFGTVTFLRASGERFSGQLSESALLDADGKKTGYITVIRDVSLEQKREAELREKQRLEGLERISRSIAHDFNNMLTVISGNLQILQAKTVNMEQMRYISEAIHATEMGERLNKRLMTFSQHGRPAPAFFDVNTLIETLAPVIQRVVGETIVLSLSLAANQSTVCADESELENAIVNLVLNARDAMPGGGYLRIGTYDTELESRHYLCICVSDNGIGMTSEVKSRAVEPFFSTKAPGKGTGLGLASVNSFVQRSNGQLRVDSQAGKGTMIDILLPALSKIDRPVKDINIAQTEGCIPGIKRTILVVDDHASVRQVTAQMLEGLGYGVLQASTGIEALALLRNRKIDLVLSDIVMPGPFSGFALRNHLAAIYPDLPILLTSGFPYRDDAGDDIATGSTPTILSKPYNQERLAKAVTSALSRPAD